MKTALYIILAAFGLNLFAVTVSLAFLGFTTDNLISLAHYAVTFDPIYLEIF